jgi:hypothetical protein
MLKISHQNLSNEVTKLISLDPGIAKVKIDHTITFDMSRKEFS